LKQEILHMKPQETQTRINGAQTNDAPVKPERTGPSKWAIMAIVAVGVFMATLDSSIVNICLPAIATDFGVPLDGAVEWVVIAYLVATASILLTAGRLADMIGNKIVWLAGLVVFTGGSALCGAAPSLTFLIVARALQGLGGALLMSISPALLTSAFPAHERGRALGLNAIYVALGVSIGPTLGGFITSAFSWHWIFSVNVPIGLIGIIATLRVLPGRLQRKPGQFDPLGALLLAIGMAGLTAGLSFGQELGWSSPPIIGMLTAGILALIALPFSEMRAPNPVIVLSLLRNRVFSSALLSLLLSYLALFAVSFMMPFYLEQLRHFPTAQAGLLLTPVPITLAIVAPISGSLADRFGSRWLAAGGLTIACAGLVFISQMDAHSSLFDIVWRLVLTGFGQAIFQSPNNSALLGAAPREHRGSASGFLATGRTLGQSLSIALAGAIFASLGGSAAGLLLVANSTGPQTAHLEQVFTSSFHITFLVCAGIAAIGIFASLVRGKGDRKKA
jgi:EmrB/QacA subfamily drug resistance transporter